MTNYGSDYLNACAAKPTPTVIPPPLNQYYHLPKFNTNRPYRPMTVTGFKFSLADRTFDFTGIPEFRLSQLQSLLHVKSNTLLYKRGYISLPGCPLPTTSAYPGNVMAIDDVVVPLPPDFTSTPGLVLKLASVPAEMLETDEVFAYYNLPDGYVPWPNDSFLNVTQNG